jgi:hypothetical protein
MLRKRKLNIYVFTSKSQVVFYKFTQNLQRLSIYATYFWFTSGYKQFRVYRDGWKNAQWTLNWEEFARMQYLPKLMYYFAIFPEDSNEKSQVKLVVAWLRSELTVFQMQSWSTNHLTDTLTVF